MESQGLIAMDGSVDLKGRPVLRSKTGRWKACSFIVVYEVFERMAYYGIASNLVIYLTTKLHEGTVTSSTNVSNWSGAIWMTPVIGAYIADTHWGRYWTFTVFSFVYILGMVILTLAVALPSLKPQECQPSSDLCKKASSLQVGIFYFALYVLAVGTGGTKPNISTIGADQFDEFDPKEKLQKSSFFNWWIFSVFLGMLFADSFLIYIQDRVGFTVGYAIPTAGLIISLVLFLIGTPFYRHKVQNGNPFNRMAQVIIAAVRKWKANVPSDPTELYEIDPKEYVAEGRFPISHTPVLRNKRPAMTCAIFWQIFALALCGTTLFQNLYFAGLEYTSATFATATTNLIPVVTFVMATTFRIEKVDIRNKYGQAKVVGTIVCVGGAMLMTFYKGPVLVGLSGVLHNTWILGALMLFASCLFWSGWLTFQAPVVQKYPAEFSLTAIMMVQGTVQCALVALCFEPKASAWKLKWDIQLFSIVYSGILCFAFAFFVQTYCIRLKGPIFAAMFNPTSTILVAILEPLILHVKYRLGSLLGTIFIIAGLYSVLWGKANDGDNFVGNTETRKAADGSNNNISDCNIGIKEPLLEK